MAAANQVQPTIEVDNVATETDSSYGDEISSYTASLTSSVLNYRDENGRTYHGYHDGKYMLPNDDDEQDRLDMLHELSLTMTDRKLFAAPIGKSPQRVLDVGTGTGIWAIDFADEFPSAEVIGVDLSPIQPSMVPPNAKFVVDDIEQEWVYDVPFDFIHVRDMACSLKDYKAMIKKCYDNTVPGGWVEIQDWDITLNCQDDSTNNTTLEKYNEALLGGFKKAGIVSCPGSHLEEWFTEAGFKDVHVQRFPIPLGAWPKDKHLKTLGLWNLLQAETGFEAVALAVLTRMENWSKSEVTVLVAKVRKEARDSTIHAFYYKYLVYGRKPE